MDYKRERFSSAPSLLDFQPLWMPDCPCMFHFTRRRRRRWSLPLIAVMLLHWCLGVGVAMADVLCLEPDGKAVLELNGKPCLDAPAEKATGQLCVDLAIDDGHATDKPAPAKSLQPPLLPALLPVYSFLYLFDSPPLTAILEPPALSPNSHPVALRATTVLLI